MVLVLHGLIVLGQLLFFVVVVIFGNCDVVGVTGDNGGTCGYLGCGYLVGI